ncbi:MAG: hypothetical protein RIC35_08285 [Marinoscillum sp.]
MILDHQSIIRKAQEILKKELNHQPIGLNLLTDRFTMPELQALYETVLEKSLDRRNFRRKMLSYDTWFKPMKEELVVLTRHLCFTILIWKNTTSLLKKG